jgi:hypothetical protein
METAKGREPPFLNDMFGIVHWIENKIKGHLFANSRLIQVANS